MSDSDVCTFERRRTCFHDAIHKCIFKVALTRNSFGSENHRDWLNLIFGNRVGHSGGVEGGHSNYCKNVGQVLPLLLSERTSPVISWRATLTMNAAMPAGS